MRLFLLLALCLFCRNAPAQDTLAPASTRYAHPNLLKRIFLGGNYRKTWETPVRVPLFHIQSTNGGYVIKKLGGGQQTKSLRIKDTGGHIMVIRTVDKTVDKALESKNIKSSFIKSITQDMISAAHPYGAVAVPPIAAAVGILSTDPVLYYVPDDPVLDSFRSVFANQMVVLEKRKPLFLSNDKLRKTEDLLDDLARKKPLKIDLPMLLQARLVDMLIGDWDRHGGQWKWGYRKEGDSTYVYPVPVDHDQAFFHSSGLLVSLVRPFTMKHLVGFKDNMGRIKKLNRKEWDFDKAFIGQLSCRQWQDGIRRFQQKVSDSVLRMAVNRMPGEIVALHGEALFRKLQGRRNTLLCDGLRYYRFLEKRPLNKLAEHAKEAREEKVTKEDEGEEE